MKNRTIKRICLALSIILVLCIAIKGCCYEKKLDNPNPTSYIFDTSIEQVRTAIVNNKEKYETNKMLLWSNNEDKKIISHKDIKMDAWLSQFNNHYSKIYFQFGNPLIYFFELHIHLDSISENKTKVEIFTLDPEVFIFGIGYGHFGFNNEKKVQPSTIEEYEILLSIGEQLGEKGMPACNYPCK